jgi:hypothetical protein
VLVAAMILGLIAGIGEFVGGMSHVIYELFKPSEEWNPQNNADIRWWAVMLIPLGIIAITGAILSWPIRSQKIAGVVLIFACLANIGIGLAAIPSNMAGIYLFVPAIMLGIAGTMILGKKQP